MISKGLVVVEHLIKNGDKSIAFITVVGNRSIVKERVNCYLSALKKYNLSVCQE